MKDVDPTTNFSAKIKRVLVELQDYSYFHGPSEIGNIDDRFLGRTPMFAKLQTILTNHETKSGCYLVTGYRGAGKSSLVAKVLSEIGCGQLRTGRSSRYFRIFAPLLPITLLNLPYPGWEWLSLLLPGIPFLFALRYVWQTDWRRDELRLGVQARPRLRRRLALNLSRLGRTFYMGKERSPDLRYRMLVQDILLLCTIELIAFATYAASSERSFIFRATTSLGLFIALFVLTTAATEYKRAYRTFKRDELRQILKGWRWLRVWEWLRRRLETWWPGVSRLRRPEPRAAKRPIYRITWMERLWLYRDVLARTWHSFRRYINFSHRVYIKINLGQDDLQDIEILRLIATNIYTKYKVFWKFGLADLVWRFLRLVVLFLGVGTLYYYKPVYRMNLGLKYQSQMFRYFPSQGSFLLTGETSTLNRLLIEHTGKKSFDLDAFAVDYNREIKPIYKDVQLRPQYAPGIAGSLRKTAVSGLAYVDLFTHLVYTRLRDNLPVVSWVQRSYLNDVKRYHLLEMSEQFQFVPRQLDYLFIAYFFLTWLTIDMLLRLRPFGIITHGVILRRLRDLNDAIEAQVTQEKSGAMGTPSFLSLSFGTKSAKVYPIASIREIEKRLIEILDDIDRIPRLTVRPHFLFIFDELDKIEAHANLTISTREEEAATDRDYVPSSYEAARERQHRILALLSNLKHFFTTAKAKFIFIAGREMFDASLADVSDRHFFMGSIFNDVIYVPSFLRDPSDGHLADITSMTESYVCRFLLRPAYRDEEVSLRSYNEYLRQEFFDDEAPGLSPVEQDLLRRRREKVIVDLAAFIIYLTYRSNGAPKKITRFLESQICRASRSELQGTDCVTVGKCVGSLYLKFGYYDQYTFGLVSYLANPLYLSLNKTIKDFGDKLLVSISFLVDHIYKFHGFGFSWRNLEALHAFVWVAPEMPAG